ncbi:porin [Nocardia sp. SYP-A9097]|uniref:MspA family porin n=1 Tax=Nocardia sp. SYP-A9097 TaxID=2663237 RepID=UPI00129B349E|nr:MspA family porin [Nocardia sp. SYP-A9097]MRH88961.1 porin [Nocardia sp. SYP-A9097]
MFCTGNRARFGGVLGAALAVLAAAGAGRPGTARADTFIPLPGGMITRALEDGTSVTIRIDGESAKISGSLGDTPVHRNVWVTGRASVDLTGPSASSATIKISPGYVVGCQVDIASLSPNNNGAGEDDWNPTTLPSLSQSLGDGITLGPGQAVVQPMLDLERPDDYGQESHKRYNKIPGPHTSVTWVDETFAVDGCGGYAQARSFVAVEIDETTFIGNVLLWGEPFSMG